MIVIEAMACCLIVVAALIIGISKGAQGMAFFYEKEVQDRCIEKGLITKEKLERNKKLFYLSALIFFGMVLFCVYVINGARGFAEGFRQLCFILVFYGLFDRLFIDNYWVGHTVMWEIPGTEDLKPYIPRKQWIRKWIGVIVVFPLTAALLSLIMSLILK